MLTTAFFLQPTLLVARQLLGQQLRAPQGVLQIVETEAYCVDDPACHAFRRKTRANAAMFGPPGTAYVHINYGIHHCLNVVCQEEGVAEAVLIRAVMGEVALRGPGRLGKALGLCKERHDGMPLLDASSLVWLAAGEAVPDASVTQTTRVGITKAADRPWRFHITASPAVSRR